MDHSMTALITGASRGIGKATAKALLDTGLYSNLVLICRKEKELLLSYTEELKHSYPEVSIYPFFGDAGDISFFEAIHSFLSEKGISVDLIINNAAISYVGLLIDMTPSEWNASINANLTSCFNTCHTFLPDMIHRKYGRIINVSSVWGLVGASCEVAYSASKGAVNSFTMALAKELAPSNISVNAVAFGMVDTDMNSHLSDEEKQEIVDSVPALRMLPVSEAAETIRKLSEMPMYVTGEVLKCDGGWI